MENGDINPYKNDMYSLPILNIKQGMMQGLLMGRTRLI